MRVILLQDVRGLGKKHDVKDVADGHAKNFLIPKGFVQPATRETLRDLERVKMKTEKEETILVKHLTELARKISESSVEFPMRTDETGAVFGSVNKEMIFKAMRDHKWIGAERVDILLDHPLKTLGEHIIPVDLKRGITAQLKIILKPLLPQT